MGEGQLGGRKTLAYHHFPSPAILAHLIGRQRFTLIVKGNVSVPTAVYVGLLQHASQADPWGLQWDTGMFHCT